MLLFLHMHKCAGSTVRKSAKKSGMVLPDRHKNGNLTDAQGRAVRFSLLSKHESKVLLCDQRDRGVDFVAMEMDFPPLSSIPNKGVELFTILRDPLERAISNFRYAKRQGGAPADWSFRRFMNNGYSKEGPLSRSANYYVRKLIAADSLDDLGPDSLSAAENVLRTFADVIVLGRHDLAARLRRLGITKLATANVAAVRPPKVELTPEQLLVSEEDIAWFRDRNRLDQALFDGALASRPDPVVQEPVAENNVVPLWRWQSAAARPVELHAG